MPKFTLHPDNVDGGLYYDIYYLEVGDYFIEDTYPEIYQVSRFDTIDLDRYIFAIDIETKQETRFFYAPGFQHYGPRIYKLMKLEDSDPPPPDFFM